MPVIFRYKGYRFFFYSNEGSPREPVHVHVRGSDGEAKFWLHRWSIWVKAMVLMLEPCAN